MFQFALLWSSPFQDNISSHLCLCLFIFSLKYTSFSCTSFKIGLNLHSQQRFTLLTVVVLHLQQPAVTSLPQEGGGIWIFATVAAHVQLDIRGADGAAELCEEHSGFQVLHKTLIHKWNVQIIV